MNNNNKLVLDLTNEEPQNYYDHEMPCDFGEPDYIRRACSDGEIMMRRVSQIIAFSDCTDERITKIVYNGVEIEYTGWQPGNVMEYADKNDNVVWSGCFPQWEH